MHLSLVGSKITLVNWKKQKIFGIRNTGNMDVDGMMGWWDLVLRDTSLLSSK